MRIRFRKEKGVALIMAMAILATVLLSGTAYVNSSTQNVRLTRTRQSDVEMMNLCDAAIQAKLVALWRPFKSKQNFTDLDNALKEASGDGPRSSSSGSLAYVGNFSVGVVSYTIVDSYTRFATIRGVGWIDVNHNGQLDEGEPRKVVDVQTQFALGRSQVFDYAYFVNNYGWMQGFGSADLVVNGDMRANGNFDFSGGSPTINGSVYATENNKLDPGASGIVNITPTQWDNSTYINHQATDLSNGPRMRQGYNAAQHGAKPSGTFDQWRDIIYDNNGSEVYDNTIKKNRVEGAVIGDKNGIKTYGGTVLDNTPTSEVTMPNLSDISYYQSLSQTWTDTKSNWLDGTVNADYGKGSYLQVWNSTTNQYDTITTSGVLTGSVALIGSSDHPIKIHGPVTITQDALIKGYVQGQGTLYTGRNVHIMGSIKYKSPPDFRGSNPNTIDQVNEKKDVLGLAASASIIMGDTRSFGYYPLAFMTPPFTKGRWDDDGNYIPAFDANQTDGKRADGTNRYRYQPTLTDAQVSAFGPEGINQIDAILYTNFVGGGNLATSGGGCKFNGTIISKDEAMVLWSLPMIMNYDSRIKERSMGSKPLIDIQLPRAPNLTRMTWQYRVIH